MLLTYRLPSTVIEAIKLLVVYEIKFEYQCRESQCLKLRKYVGLNSGWIASALACKTMFLKLFQEHCGL